MLKYKIIKNRKEKTHMRTLNIVSVHSSNNLVLEELDGKYSYWLWLQYLIQHCILWSFITQMFLFDLHLIWLKTRSIWDVTRILFVIFPCYGCFTSTVKQSHLFDLQQCKGSLNRRANVNDSCMKLVVRVMTYNKTFNAEFILRLLQPSLRDWRWRVIS